MLTFSLVLAFCFAVVQWALLLWFFRVIMTNAKYEEVFAFVVLYLKSIGPTLFIPEDAGSFLIFIRTNGANIKRLMLLKAVCSIFL